MIQKISGTYLRILQTCPNIISNLSEDCLKIVPCLVSRVLCLLYPVSCLVPCVYARTFKSLYEPGGAPSGGKRSEKTTSGKNPQKQQPVSPKNETVASMRTAAKF